MLIILIVSAMKCLLYHYHYLCTSDSPRHHSNEVMLAYEDNIDVDDMGGDDNVSPSTSTVKGPPLSP